MEEDKKKDVFFQELEIVFKSEYSPRRNRKFFKSSDKVPKKRSPKVEDTSFPCDKCEIKGSPVLSKVAGKPKPVMIIGMYPGWEEVSAGKVFVGESGTYMHEVLEDVGFAIEDTHETNVMKCRPLDSKGKPRPPTDKEFKTCGKWLVREIQEVNPSLIILMGDLPLRFFFNRKSVTPVRGQVKVKGDYKFLITYNPAHIIREPEKSLDRKAFESDIRSAFEIYTGVNRVKNREYILVNDLETLDIVTTKLSNAKALSVDLESYAPGTTKKEKKSLDPYAEGFKIISASISMETDKAYCFLLEHPESKIPLEIVLSKISPLLTKPIPKVGQNIKYDFKIAGVHFGIYMENIVFDTMLASALLDSRKGIHNLDRLAMDWLGERSYKYEQDKIGTYIPPADKLCIRNCTDSDYSLRLYPLMKQRLIEEDLYNYYIQTEIPATPALGRVEIRGLPVNLDRVREISKTYETKLEKALQQIYEYQEVKDIKDFNIDSNPNLQELFFEKLGFDPVRKTKTGFSVDKDTLKVLQVEYKHPLLSLLHEYKTSTKFKGTYIDPLITTHVKYDSRVHPTFTQHVAATGRLSCVDPNMQNIPVRDEIRGHDVMSCYEAPEGFKIGLGDYNQMELRILAQVSQDPVMLEAYRRGEDLHAKTAQELSKVAGFLVTRQDAKALNFGMVYRMTEYGLAESLGVEPKIAKVYLDAYLQLYKGVKEYQEEQIRHLKQFGYVKTLFGRKRYIRMYGDDDREAENQAVNTPIQGTATDINTVALTVLVKLYLEEGFRSFPISVIHDAIMFELSDQERDLVELNLYIMENLDLPFLKDVKLKVDWSEGKTWADAKFKEKK